MRESRSIDLTPYTTKSLELLFSQSLAFTSLRTQKMSTEILQETRTRMYKHANRPVPLQNIRLNFTENPYHRVIRGNTYNLRTTSSGLVRLNTHLSTPQHIQRQHLYFPPVHQSPTGQPQPTPIRHTPKKVKKNISEWTWFFKYGSLKSTRWGI